MTKAEKLAYIWLRQQGYKSINFNSLRYFDFLADGKKFEVKTPFENQVTFTQSQIYRLEDDDIILFYETDGDDALPAIIPWKEVKEAKTIGEWTTNIAFVLTYMPKPTTLDMLVADRAVAERRPYAEIRQEMNRA